MRLRFEGGVGEIVSKYTTKHCQGIDEENLTRLQRGEEVLACLGR